MTATRAALIEANRQWGHARARADRPFRLRYGRPRRRPGLHRYRRRFVRSLLVFLGYRISLVGVVTPCLSARVLRAGVT